MARARLPKIDFGFGTGEITKATQDRANSGGLLLSQNADGFEELDAWGQVPGSTRMCDPAGAAWESLHYYEHYTLAGVLTREIIGLAGTELKRINSDKTLNTLDTGYNAETLTSVTTLDRIHFVSPQNYPKKFDGEVVTNWGVKAPGTEKTVLESFDDNTNFLQIFGTKSDVDGIDSVDGAITVAKTDNDELYTQLTGTGRSWNLGPAASDTLYFSILVPEGASQELEQSSHCIEMWLSDGANVDKWYWYIGELVEGRNLLSLDLSSPDVDASADHSAITTFVIRIYLDSVSKVQSGFILDDLYYLDDSQVTPTNNGTGAVTGNVTYRYTYVSKYGQESNAGIASASFAAGDTGMQILVNGIDFSPDPQVVKRNIYRDLNGDALWQYIGSINDNVTTVFTDNVSSGARGTTAPLASDTSKDYSPPRRMRQIVMWEGYMFGIDEQNRFQVNINYKGRPEAWPTARHHQFEQEIVALIPWAHGLIAAGSDKIHILEGREYNEFRWREFFPTESIGVAGWRAWAPFKRTACVWHDNGPFSMDEDPWYIGTSIKDQVEDMDPVSFRDIHIVHDRFWFRMLFFIQSANGGDYDTVKSYSYGQGGGQISPDGYGVDPIDFRNGKWSRLVLPSGMNPKCSVIVEQSGDQPQCWIGCDDGFIYWLGDPDAVNYADGYGAAAMNCSLETSWVRSEEEISLRPRFLSLSATATNKSTWTAKIETADVPDPETADILTTKTITFDVGPGSTNREIPIEAPCYGNYVKLTLDNNTVGEDGLFRSVEVEVVPRRIRRAA